MTSESEHCCRGENLGDALLQQQEVGRRGRARGLRLGLVAIALGILPLPIFVAFFLFRGHAPFPGSPQDAGRNAASFHSLTLPAYPKIQFGRTRSAFRQKSKRHPSNFEKCQSKLQLSWQIQSRGNSTKIQTARHALRLQRLVCGLSKTREFRTLEDSKPGLLRVSARSRTHANTTRRVAVQRTRRVAHSRIRARGRIFSPFRPTRADSSPRVGVASRVSVAMSKMTEKAALLLNKMSSNLVGVFPPDERAPDVAHL